MKRVKYSYWREFIMWLGVGVLCLCGLLVGHTYFNQTLTDIIEGESNEK